MKKVLFFIDTLEDGGVSKVLLDLLKYINKNKYEITFMSLYNLGGGIEKVKEYATISIASIYLVKMTNHYQHISIK